jgi:phosphatidate cytidylyltransferase
LNQSPAKVSGGPHHTDRWGDLRTRVLSAAVLAPVALVCIWIGGTAFAGLIGLITMGLAYEWITLCHDRASPTRMLIFAALPAAVACVATGAPYGALAAILIATLAATVIERGVSAAKPLAFGVPYLGLGAIAIVWLRQAPGSGRTNVIVLLLLVWASDIGAYLVGRVIGGPRLAPKISPGKTVSGAVGGLAAVVGVGWLAALSVGGSAVTWRAMVFAALIGCVSQAGDLFESLLKRHFRVKDSGRLIPGHGGLLDRLDALLAAAPVAALLALLLGRGVVIWQ